MLGCIGFLNKHSTFLTKLLFLTPRKMCIFRLCFHAFLWLYNPLLFCIYFYYSTERNYLSGLLMAERTVKSNSFISLCSPWHFLLFMLFTVMLFLSFHIRDLLLLNGSVLFFSTLFRGLLSSSHLLFWVSVVVSFSSFVISASEDCIQSHGFNLKPSLEMWSASPLLTHTSWELSCTAFIPGPAAWWEMGLDFSPNWWPHFMLLPC